MAKTGQNLKEFGQALQGSDLWVFGYGSLMWNPGFAYRETKMAKLYGYHRDFAMWSARHRGTPERPGLVLTLCPGGSCVGRGFLVDKSHVASVYAYLLDREIGAYAYRPALVSIRIGQGMQRALTFLPTPGAPQFAPGLSIEDQAKAIAGAVGGMGPNPDYLRKTIEQMAQLKLPTKRFQALELRVLGRRPIK